MRNRRIPVSAPGRGMLGILFVAISLRLFLFKEHWPVANADESIMDLMARHVAYQGEHPLFFWGQNYMGSIQAYLGAIMIQLAGSSAFSVRLGTLLIFALYLVCMYFLARLLYTPGYALFIIALLSVGSDRMLSAPLVANGGYAETMLFGAAIFLLASWLGVTMPRPYTRVGRSRLLAYAGLGVTCGLAIWSDQLILPAIFTAGLFLVRFCRQELWGRALAALLLGLLAGATPLIVYNIFASPENSSLAVLLGTVFYGGAQRVLPFWEQIAHVILISLPLATGMPFTNGIHAVCGTVEPYTGPSGSLTALFPSSNPWLCIGTRGAWSLSVLLLWGLALTAVLRSLRGQRDTRQDDALSSGAQAAGEQTPRAYARLMLLASGAIWLALFTISSPAQFTPRASSRYLICLLIVAPAVLWPLWQNLSRIRARRASGERHVHSGFALSALCLCFIICVYLVGIWDILANLPASQNSYNQTNLLIQTLLAHDAPHVYSDYNTCSLLMFQSDERIVCAVLDDQLQPGVNRYTPYLTQVEAAPRPAYLFPINSASAQALAQRLAQDTRYQSMQVAGYVLYYQQD